jgi:hypothetical protein
MRVFASFVAAAVVAASAPAAASSSKELAVDAGIPAVLFVTSPKGRSPRVGASEILRLASQLLRSRTDLRLESPEQAGLDRRQLDGCSGAGRLACWTRAARPDYEQLLMREPALGEASFDKAVKPRLEAGAGPAFLFVALVVPEGDAGDRVSWLMLDLVQAVRQIQLARRPGGPTGQALEDVIYESAVASVMATRVANDAADLGGELTAAVEQSFRPLFEHTEHWRPYGEITLLGGAPGQQVELDGQLVGEAGEGSTRLLYVRPGKHAIRVVPKPDEALDPFVGEVQVGRESAATVHAELSAARSAGLRTGLLWGGVGAAIAGGVLVARAAAGTGAPGAVAVCLDSRCMPPPRPGFLSFCDLAHPGTECGGPRVAPVGFGLLAAALVWSGGNLLLDAESDSPWLRLAGGLALGAAVFGAATLASR